MEENYGMYGMSYQPQPKYTMNWLLLHCLFALGIGLVTALLACGVDSIASGRVGAGLLLSNDFSLISEATVYCFAVVAVTTLSLTFVELAFRSGINYLQLILIDLALTLFYLLLLAITEFMAFGWAYLIVTAMTVGLIAIFIKGITHNLKAAGLTTGLLIVEYGLMFLLVNLGTMALLVGSLSLFLMLAVAMYFTLKLRKENEELIIK